jgi:hypothetical protein
MDAKYVDQFFNEGLVRISSFAEFAKHPDELRRDTKEGWGIVTHQNEAANDGKGMTIMAVMGQGSSAYVLCGSLLDNDAIRQRFGSTGIKIRNTVGFAHAISTYIPGFTFGLEGHCTYVGQRVLEGDAGEFSIDDLKVKPESNDISMEKLMQKVGTVAGDDLMFLKTDNYAHEVEYRLAWHTQRSVSNPIDIHCPEAVQFCERFS